MSNMVRRALARREKGEKGFTLVELLVVVIIIGILAAVSVPIYLNQRKKAWDSNAESDVKNAQTNVETAIVNAQGSFDSVQGTCGNAITGTAKSTGGSGKRDTAFTGPTVTCSDGVTVEINGGDDTYSISGWHDHTDNVVYGYKSSSADSGVHSIGSNGTGSFAD